MMSENWKIRKKNEAWEFETSGKRHILISQEGTGHTTVVPEHFRELAPQAA